MKEMQVKLQKCGPIYESNFNQETVQQTIRRDFQDNLNDLNPGCLSPDSFAIVRELSSREATRQ
ncbi:hypothetical protein K0M31_009057 [Melipona bicolor]|uniref:Uncharacterized protein n=1 Tax=Melipona bicolor TaxID=60889 RepID=A0AA40FNX2_9HYME|nr:hypothetical protein K0M31_009057 [Melipona bicolor]